MRTHTLAPIVASITLAIPAAAGFQRSSSAPTNAPSIASQSSLASHSIAAPASASPANASPPPAALPTLPIALPHLPEPTSNVAPSLDLDRASPWEDALVADQASPRKNSPTTLSLPSPKRIETVDQWTGAPIDHVVAKKMEVDRSDPWSDSMPSADTSL